MRARLATPAARIVAPRAIVPTLVLLVLGVVAALALLPADLTACLRLTPDRYAQQVATVEQRYQASVAELNELLNQRDANPTLVESPTWQRQFGKVGDDLTAEYQDLQALRPSPGE